MAKCPVCEKNLPGPLPPFCAQCGWNFRDDITLVPSLHEIPENIRSEYTQRLRIAQRMWHQSVKSLEILGSNQGEEFKEKIKTIQIIRRRR